MDTILKELLINTLLTVAKAELSKPEFADNLAIQVIVSIVTVLQGKKP